MTLARVLPVRPTHAAGNSRCGDASRAPRARLLEQPPLELVDRPCPGALMNLVEATQPRGRSCASSTAPSLAAMVRLGLIPPSRLYLPLAACASRR